MIFSCDFNISLDEVDNECKLTQKALMKYLVSAGCFHSDTTEYGVAKLFKNHAGWGIIDWDIHIITMPSYSSKITIETWIRKATSAFVFRDFSVYADGVNIANVTSKWIYLDLDKRVPIRISIDKLEQYGIDSRSAVSSDLSRPVALEIYDSEYKYNIRKSEIDLNGHVHNTNYLDIAREYLDFDEYKNLRNIRIYYKKEIPYGADLTVKKSVIEDKYYFCLSTDADDYNALIELS